MLKRIFCVIFFAVLLCSFASTYANAEHYSIDGYTIPIDISVNGSKIKTSEGAYLEGGVTYVPVRAICNALGLAVQWDDATRCAAVTSADGESAVFDVDAGTLQKGDSVIPGQAYLYNSTLFTPVRVLSESFGYTVGWDDYYYEVTVIADGVTVPEQYKDTRYTNADILLISQVLTNEIGSGSLEAKIAVANVICNRAESNLFPDTYYDVIYDARYGSIQFSCAYNGKINNTPTLHTVLATKCALNGAVVAEGCLFFQAEYVKNSWMDKNRSYAMAVGGNAFFY